MKKTTWLLELEFLAGRLVNGWKFLESDKTQLSKVWKHWEENTDMGENAILCLNVIAFGILIKLREFKNNAIKGGREEREIYRKKVYSLCRAIITKQKSRNNGAKWLKGMQKGWKNLAIESCSSGYGDEFYYEDELRKEVLNKIKEKMKQQHPDIKKYSWGKQKQIYGGNDIKLNFLPDFSTYRDEIINKYLTKEEATILRRLINNFIHAQEKEKKLLGC